MAFLEKCNTYQSTRWGRRARQGSSPDWRTRPPPWASARYESSVPPSAARSGWALWRRLRPRAQTLTRTAPAHHTWGCHLVAPQETNRPHDFGTIFMYLFEEVEKAKPGLNSRGCVCIWVFTCRIIFYIFLIHFFPFNIFLSSGWHTGQTVDWDTELGINVSGDKDWFNDILIKVHNVL